MLPPLQGEGGGSQSAPIAKKKKYLKNRSELIFFTSERPTWKAPPPSSPCCGASAAPCEAFCAQKYSIDFTSPALLFTKPSLYCTVEQGKARGGGEARISGRSPLDPTPPLSRLESPLVGGGRGGCKWINNPHFYYGSAQCLVAHSGPTYNYSFLGLLQKLCVTGAENREEKQGGGDTCAPLFSI